MDDAVPTSTIGRKLFILLATVAVVSVLWTGGWVWLSGEVARRMDDQLLNLAGHGISITCPERQVGGWPFRIDIDCSNPTIAESGKPTTLTVRHSRVTALVYQPTRIIIELDGPLAATGPAGESINAEWTQLQSSIGISLSGRVRPERISVVADGLAADAAKPGGQDYKLTSAHAELHARPSPDAAPGSNDLDLAVSFETAAFSVADRPIGPDGADWSVDTSVRNLPAGIGTDGTRPLLALWSENGGRLDLRHGRMVIAGFSLDGEGSLMVAVDGLVSGQIKLIAAGLPALLASPATLRGRGELIGLGGAFTLFGKPVADNSGAAGRSLDLVIDRGRIKIGPTAFGHMPPLF